MAKTPKKKLSTKGGRKRDRAGTERAIMKAAGELFAKKGYESTRTLEIAKAAHANEALITRYFGGKEGLLMAILMDPESFQALADSDCCKMEEEFALPESGRRLSEAVEDFRKQGAEVAASRQQFMRISCSRAMVDPKMASMVRTQIIDRRVPKLAEAVRRFVDPKKVGQDELEAAVMIMASANFMFNFMGRHIYQFGDDRVNRANRLLAKMLGDHFNDRASIKAKRGK